MGLIVRTEPIGVKYMEDYLQLKGMLQKAGWLCFIEKFNGYHNEITKSFSRSFDGMDVEIGDIKFAVTESLIAEATEFPRLGERLFKNKEFHDKSWKVILKNIGIDTSVFRKGIPISALKNKCRSMSLILQKFITCEGRFGSMYVYHIRLLMIFSENGTLNLPFFLLNSLRRMATNVQNKVESIKATLYNHGLVEILVEFQLRSVGDTWELFLVRNFFQDAPYLSEGSHIKRSRKRNTNLTIQNTRETSAKNNDLEEPISEKLTEIRK